MEYKINENGTTRDMTADEIEQFEAMQENEPTEEPNNSSGGV